MRRLGITGHQGLGQATEGVVRERLAAALAARSPQQALSSLAEGADQIFAEEALAGGAGLVAVIPCRGYRRAFESVAARRRFDRLAERAVEVIELDFPGPGEEAFWAAGRRVVQLSDELLAVWDGEPSGGLGGTADVVAYAERCGTPVTRIWPEGSRRGS